MNVLEQIIEILELLEVLKDDIIEDNISNYDLNIDNDNYPKTYDLCPHCNTENFNYDFIKEVLDDAIAKVKCRNCDNNFYTDVGK